MPNPGLRQPSTEGCTLICYFYCYSFSYSDYYYHDYYYHDYYYYYCYWYCYCYDYCDDYTSKQPSSILRLNLHSEPPGECEESGVCRPKPCLPLMKKTSLSDGSLSSGVNGC